MNILIGIGAWIKTHIVASIVIGTVVVSGAVATPIIVNNMKDNVKVEEKQEKVPSKEEEKINEDKEQLDEKEEKPVEENKESVNDNKSNKEDKNQSKEQPKKNNSNKTENSNKVENNKTENNQPTSTPAPTLSIKGNAVYYGNNEVIGFNRTTPRYWSNDLISPRINTGLINSLSREIKQDILKNYMCKAVPGGCIYDVYSGLNIPNVYNDYAGVLKISMVEEAQKESAKHQKSIENAKYCIQYLNSGGTSECTEYPIDAWQRVIDQCQDIVNAEKHDTPIIQKSARDFKTMINLLNS